MNHTDREIRKRTHCVRTVLWGTLFANWAIAAAKLIFGLSIESTALIADSLHSFLDGTSNIIGLVAIHLSSKPADREHPYGHQKFEALAALAIGVLIGMGGLELGRMAWTAVFHNAHPVVTPEAFGMMLVSITINLTVTRIESVWGRKLRSTLLLADAQHTMSDVFVTIAVTLSLFLSWLGVSRIDGLVAIGILIFVAWTGWNVIRQAAGILADTARVDPQKISEVCRALPHVSTVFDIRSRGMEGSVYVDLKVGVAPHLTVENAHCVADSIERALPESFPEIVDVVVHIEPHG